MTKQTVENRKKHIAAAIEEQLPGFFKACDESDAEFILMHQDAFAADYQIPELLLLGMAVKYAGMKGKEIRIICTNRETLKP